MGCAKCKPPIGLPETIPLHIYQAVFQCAEELHKVDALEMFMLEFVDLY